MGCLNEAMERQGMNMRVSALVYFYSCFIFVRDRCPKMQDSCSFHETFYGVKLGQ